MSNNKPILCLDFDGVIHAYSKGWQDGTIYDSVTPGFFNWVVKVRDHFKLVIHSSRLNHIQEPEYLREWLGTELIRWKTSNIISVELPPYIDDFDFASRKPPAFLTIDDRAITFNGDWSSAELAPEKLFSFKPWNAKK